MSSQQVSNPEEIVKKFNFMKSELTAITSKISELEMEKEEHQLVLESLKPMNKDRKCFRLVNGVLLEQTVEAVLPIVEQNQEGILAIMRQLAENYKKKEDELTVYQDKYKIKVRA